MICCISPVVLVRHVLHPNLPDLVFRFCRFGRNAPR
nr:MAG TPA: hypothetical protein [Caudoviricetes sp.]